ncbi:MAG: CusA/CzcA family heavy metal efflux RND transporter [Bacteroidia bacterium]|nr:CusA/CzcA family heavy metal efflux RND transporter [Bacteroidia bacterium]
MLSKIINFSIQNKLLVIAATLILVFYGAYQVTQLPIDAVPDITNNQVQVITVVPALSAPDVERLITFPIEQNCRNIPHITEMRSFSRAGLSLVTIVFEDDVDIYWARQQITERLKLAEKEIPQGIATPELGPVTTGLGEIYQYVLKPKKGYEKQYSLTDLRTIQDWVVKRQLIGIKGIADVSSFGGYVKQYEIAVEPQKLNAYKLTITDLFHAIEKNNQNTGGAYIEKGPTVVFIRTEGLLQSISELEQIVVAHTQEGIPILLKDVAKVKIGHATRYGALSYNDEGEVAGGIVMMLKGENSHQVIKAVKERIAQIQNNLPEGLEIVPYLDRTKMVNAAIKTVSTNLIEGALIVIFVLVLLLGNIRAGLIVASVIPLSMLFAIILMNTFGVSGNLMSLGALDFGLIVDGAVIIVEAVLHNLMHVQPFKSIKISQNEMDKTVAQASTRMMNSAVFGQIIILIVYLPIFTLQGIEGKMFKPMAQTVIFALLGAFILSLTYIPVVSSLLINKKIQNKTNFSSRVMETLSKWHQYLLAKALRFSVLFVSLCLILFAVSIFVLLHLGGEFIPQIPEGDFAVETRLLKGSSLNASIQACQQSAKVLLAHFPEIEKIVSKTGNSEIPTDPMPMEHSDMMIILKDKSQWTSAYTWQELSEKMAQTLKENIPGVSYSFQYPVAMRFNELMTGARQDVVCKIFGENLDTLSKYAKKLGQIVSTLEGATEIYVEPIDGLPQLVISYYREELAKYGISIQDANQIITAALAGQSAGLLFEDEKRFEIIVRLAAEYKQDVEQIRSLLIPTRYHTQVPLYQIASVQIKQSVNQIQREEAKRRIIVGFNVKDRDVQTVVENLQKQVQKRLKLPPGYYITYGGSFEHLQSAKQRLMIAVPIALSLIFLLLYLAFRSVAQSLLIYSAIPLSAMGGIFFLALRGMPFSVSAGVGFIALFGVAVLNGIVLISEFNRLKNEGISDLYEVVAQGTRTRLRPVLMTALVASLGFLPMAISTGAGAEVQKPLATVVIGGLLVATFLTLIVLPILYVWIQKVTLRKISPALIVLFSALCFNTPTYAQKPISLKNAIDTALKNHLSLKMQSAQIQLQKALLPASYNLPPTNFTFEYGQMNSIYQDNRLSITQSTSFPTVYHQQKKLQNAQIEQENLNLDILKKQITKKVCQTFYTLLYLNQKQILLHKIDSILQNVHQKMEIRFSKGDIAAMEKNASEIQSQQIKTQLQQLQAEITYTQKEFQYWLNTTQLYTADLRDTMVYKPILRVDTTSVHTHVYLKALRQSIHIAAQKVRLQKHKFLPDIVIGYTSQTLQGIGADEVFYTRRTRFNAFQLGLSIPLFYTAQKAQLNAAKVDLQIAQMQYAMGIKVFEQQYLTAYYQYQSAWQKVQMMKNSTLPKAESILMQAHQQYQSGAVSYLEWAMLIQTAIQIQMEYLESLKNLHLSLTEVQYYQN